MGFPCVTFGIFPGTGAKSAAESQTVLYCLDQETSQVTIAFVFVAFR